MGLLSVHVPSGDCDGCDDDDGKVILLPGMSCVSWTAYLPPQQKPAAATFGILLLGGGMGSEPGMMGLWSESVLGNGEDLTARMKAVTRGATTDGRLWIRKEVRAGTVASVVAMRFAARRGRASVLGGVYSERIMKVSGGRGLFFKNLNFSCDHVCATWEEVGGRGSLGVGVVVLITMGRVLNGDTGW